MEPYDFQWLHHSLDMIMKYAVITKEQQKCVLHFLFIGKSIWHALIVVVDNHNLSKPSLFEQKINLAIVIFVQESLANLKIAFLNCMDK